MVTPDIAAVEICLHNNNLISVDKRLGSISLVQCHRINVGLARQSPHNIRIV
jgi:hypothetical protein